MVILACLFAPVLVYFIYSLWSYTAIEQDEMKDHLDQINHKANHKVQDSDSNTYTIPFSPTRPFKPSIRLVKSYSLETRQANTNQVNTSHDNSWLDND